jgi:hypothetical protein
LGPDTTHLLPVLKHPQSVLFSIGHGPYLDPLFNRSNAGV